MTIVSFEYNLVFIKTTKTAGTSIEVDLSRRVEEAAVVTPIIPATESHRPRNYQTPSGRFFNHMTAAQIRELLGAQVFDRMYKFCVERDPVEKCISHFHMLRNSEIHNQKGRYRLDWDDYCKAGVFPLDLDKYSEVSGEKRVLLADRILRYERLNEDLPPLLESLGIPGFTLQAREKSSYRLSELIRPQDVTARQRELIETAFATTCEATGLYRKIGGMTDRPTTTALP